MLSQKKIKFFVYLFLITLVCLFQGSFINGLPGPFNNLNIILAVLFFVSLMVDYHLGLALGLFCALVLELYSPLPWGGIFMAVPISIFLLNFMFKLFFTNRSLFSLAVLSSIGLIFYNLFILAYSNLIYYFGWSELKIQFSGFYLSQVFWQLFLTIVLLSVVYLLLRFFSKRFRSVFLLSGRR